MGEYKKVIDYHQQSLKIDRQLGNSRGEATSLNNLGLAYLNSKQPKQAEKYLRDAIKVHESLRSRLGNNHALKVSFFDTQAITYRYLQQTLIEQKQYNKALEIAERGRTRAFTELIIEKQQLSSSPLPNIEQIRLVAKEQKATIVYYSITLDDLYIWVVKPTGLPRAFISAGTPSIVVSLWRVSDKSTAFFMPEFYRQLKTHKNKAKALREAMLKTMKKYPDTRDWSAFLLIGEAD